MNNNVDISPGMVSLHHARLTVVDLETGGKRSTIFRSVSLKKYNTRRYITKDPPKPVSRVTVNFDHG